MTMGDFATPMPESWESHWKQALKNKDHFTKLLHNYTNIKIVVANLSDLELDNNSETEMSHLTSEVEEDYVQDKEEEKEETETIDNQTEAPDSVIDIQYDQPVNLEAQVIHTEQEEFGYLLQKVQT